MRGGRKIEFRISLGYRLRLYLKNPRMGGMISGRALAYHVQGPGLICWHYKTEISSEQMLGGALHCEAA